MIENLKNDISSNYNIYKDYLVDEGKIIFESIEHSKIIMYIETVNENIIKFRNKILDIFESESMSWIDIYHNKNNSNNIHHVKKWPLFVMLISAIICLSFSAIFHLFCALDQEAHEFLNRMDYAGISILIAGSCYPPYFYFFYCNTSILL